MFKHILLPTDGSLLSKAAIVQGIELAKSLNAKVTGFYAMPLFRLLTYRSEMLEEVKERHDIDCEFHAQQYLAVIEDAAKKAEVPCELYTVRSDFPYDAIINAATEKSCDLIVMASHGKKGMKGVFIGSETQKVLTLIDKIPVLVFR
jgi:nucleotide-binding universal stress UspA family protein